MSSDPKGCFSTGVGWTNPVFVSTTADGDFDPNEVP